MEQKTIMHLLSRLTFLGYHRFEIKNIIKDAIGVEHVDGLNRAQAGKVIRHLKMYELLGSDYMQTYSK